MLILTKIFDIMKTKFFCTILCVVSCLLTVCLDASAAKDDEIEVTLPITITCSRSTDDGIGRCYKNMGFPWAKNCQFSGYQTDFCTTSYYV